jgi:hypothetical protein
MSAVRARLAVRSGPRLAVRSEHYRVQRGTHHHPGASDAGSRGQVLYGASYHLLSYHHHVHIIGLDRFVMRDQS